MSVGLMLKIQDFERRIAELEKDKLEIAKRLESAENRLVTLEQKRGPGRPPKDGRRHPD